MKNIIIGIMFTGGLFLISSCNKCEEIVPESCGNFVPNSEWCGWTVATCYAGNSMMVNLNDPVAVIYNTSNNMSVTRGEDWGTSINTIHPPDWVFQKIGQVFGIAIDKDENIYLAASDVYNYDGNSTSPFPYAQIFKCSPPSWTPVPLVSLPNTGGRANGTGNIAYDKINHQLFATNIEDGKIYRINLFNNSIEETYDPLSPDNSTPGPVFTSDRPWSVGINVEEAEVKVYFTVVDNLYSVKLINGRFPPAGSEILEYKNLPLATSAESRVTDMAFSQNGTKLLLAERSGPHGSTVIGLERRNSSWSLNNKDYWVGSFQNNTNSAGGVDFAHTGNEQSASVECDNFFWASGNYMQMRNGNKIYGIQGISYEGNLNSNAPFPKANIDTDLYIDFDGKYTTAFKGTIGDVEVFDCTECGDPCRLNSFIN